MWLVLVVGLFFFFSSRRRHTRYWRDWSSDVCSSDLSRGRRPAGLLQTIRSKVAVVTSRTLTEPAAPAAPGTAAGRFTRQERRSIGGMGGGERGGGGKRGRSRGWRSDYKKKK